MLIESSIGQADVRVCAGGGLAVMGGDLPGHTEACWDGCHTTVTMLDPSSQISPYTRDRTSDIASVARKRPQVPSATAAQRVDDQFSQIAKQLLNRLQRADRFVVVGGGLVNVQALMSAGDYLELQSCWTEWFNIISMVDPEATPPAFDRDRAADISAFDAQMGPPPVGQ
jgi:hypothetical protein